MTDDRKSENLLIESEPLDSKETKNYVTPYAFSVADSLLGTPLATPAKRGIALGLDAVFIALLSQLSEIVMAGLLAWMFFKAANELKAQGRYGVTRKILRAVGAISLIFFLAGITTSEWDEIIYGDSKSEVITGNGLQLSDGIDLVSLPLKIKDKSDEIKAEVAAGECGLVNCWQPWFNTITPLLLKVQSDVDLNEAYSDIFTEVDTGLSEKDFVNLIEQSKMLFQQEAKLNVQSDASASDKAKSSEGSDKKGKGEQPSLLDWVQGTLKDMGVSLGWAAFYFSITTAWLGGQTLGKRILGIKVIKLDGSELSLWESFQRYGGYGAGLATGLMGFAQVYWDANRQAVQDKISETLVIDLNKSVR